MLRFGATLRLGGFLRLLLGLLVRDLWSVAWCLLWGEVGLGRGDGVGRVIGLLRSGPGVGAGGLGVGGCTGHRLGRIVRGHRVTPGIGGGRRCRITVVVGLLSFVAIVLFRLVRFQGLTKLHDDLQTVEVHILDRYSRT